MDAATATETTQQAVSLVEWLTLAGVGAAIVATFLAWWGVVRTIRNDRDIAKKAQTLAVILKAELTQLHEEAFKILKDYGTDDARTIATLAVAKSALLEKDRIDADKIYAILNWYEYMAVGIRHDILCEEILRNASFTTIKNIWTDAEAFVLGVRTRVKSETAYEAFEWLVDRWAKAGYTGTLPPVKSGS